jgi:hypothetical protein
MPHVLFIAHDFHGGGMGAVRQRRIVRYLASHGFRITVLCSPLAHETTSLNPESVTIKMIAALKLSSVYKSLKTVVCNTPCKENVRGNEIISRDLRLTGIINRWFMFPDKLFPWIIPAFKAGMGIVENDHVDLIYASIAPKTNGYSAMKVANKSGIPFVVEYRDLWTGTVYSYLDQPTRLHQTIHRILERRVLKQAKSVTTVSRGIYKKLYKEYNKETKDKLSVCYNFYDPVEYPEGHESKFDRFTIIYAGTMYLSRSPEIYFEGLRRFINRNRLTPRDVRFHWIGHIVAVPGVQKMVEDRMLSPFIEYGGQVSHRESLSLLQRSHVSLLIQAPNDSIHIPGKLFEAMGARTPIFAISNPCEVTEIIDQTHCGLHCPYDADMVATTLDQFYGQKQRDGKWEFKEEEVIKYSSDAMMKNIEKVLVAACK